MSKTCELLIEIGCEEIPARMLEAATRDLEAIIVALLDKAGLPHGAPRLFWTPRRLAVQIPDTVTRTPERDEQLLGPPAKVAWDGEGRPSKALHGFAKKQGMKPEDFQRIETERGVYAGVSVKRGGEGVGDVLAAGFGAAVAKMHFPKMMRWGEGEHRFVRPVHWLVALADDAVLPLELFGVKAGRASRGHRSLAPGTVEIADAASYTDALERAFVIVDPARRRARLEEELTSRARAEGGRPLDDPELLEESVGLVEYPGALVGAFEERFVERLPREVLSTCLRHHQKAFSIEGKEGLSARFAVAVNVKDDPEGHVRRGHEWVNTGRLEDALFFWSEDRKRSLADRTPELAGVVFHKDLGTYAEKTRRVVRLSRLVAERLGAGPDAAARAAALARCDLVTGLVGEFPELQGVVGGLLARADGEPEDVWRSIYGLYKPAGMTDAIPETQLGRVLGMADRLDTLAGGFAVGLVPSGSKDPFGLRRAGTSLVRLAAAEPAIELFELVDAAFAGYEGGESGPALADRAGEASEPLRAFLLERFGAIAEREGARYDEVSAVRAVAERVGLRAADLLDRARALRSFRGSDDFLALVKAAKRVRNILEQAAERGERPDPGEGSKDLALPAETALAKAVASAEDLAEQAAESRDHEGALRAIAALRPEVDRFFDEILVMDEDARLRRARLGVLAQIHALAHGTVDMAEIVVEGHEKN